MPFLAIDPGLGLERMTFDLHAPDGFLSLPVAGVMWVITIAVLAVVVTRTRRGLDERTVPLMGVTAAFVFSAQMFTFPVFGGTSGHLIGAVLAAILLGPWAATLVMTAVISVQALIFQDGGLVVLGANIFHMGIVGTIGGFALYRALCRIFGGEERARYPAAAIAAWSSVVVGSALIAFELALSGTSPIALALPAMVGVHVVIGAGEALITVAALALLRSVRPDLLRLRDLAPQGPSASVATGS